MFRRLVDGGGIIKMVLLTYELSSIRLAKITEPMVKTARRITSGASNRVRTLFETRSESSIAQAGRRGIRHTTGKVTSCFKAGYYFCSRYPYSGLGPNKTQVFVQVENLHVSMPTRKRNTRVAIAADSSTMKKRNPEAADGSPEGSYAAVAASPPV